MLLRYASRLAGRLNRNWYAVYVQTPSEAPAVVDSHTQTALSGILTLAKQLGALVFTYKGEDVVAAILRFAKEYRVGHIVVGRPGPASFWRRLLRKPSLVERLINEAVGITIVVLDTYIHEPETSSQPQRSEVAAPANSTTGPVERLRLGSLLTRDRIIIWDSPIGKEAALSMLVGLGAGRQAIDPGAVLAELLKREEESSTFINEGVAFPHARLAALSSPVVALGIARQGVSDVCTEKPVGLIFLILSPKGAPEMQVRLLGLISRALKDKRLAQSLSTAGNADEASQLLRIWDSDESSRTESRHV
jgi:two-component system sensor histidine kinase KdpD